MPRFNAEKPKARTREESKATMNSTAKTREPAFSVGRQNRRYSSRQSFTRIRKPGTTDAAVLLPLSASSFFQRQRVDVARSNIAKK